AKEPSSKHPISLSRGVKLNVNPRSDEADWNMGLWRFTLFFLGCSKGRCHFSGICIDLQASVDSSLALQVGHWFLKPALTMAGGTISRCVRKTRRQSEQ
ncbi:MAG TPA: hypothetical protein VJ044_16950, partial [Candidatus Hodarchaeales archaeon]|nr:hypothetical protein [Candidatus Hodarchaeales archaeon]